MDRCEPILCAHLLRVVDGKLLELMATLQPAEWATPVAVPHWTVRDVAAHLLDTALRKLSLARDGWLVDAVEIRSERDLVELVNRVNREGVTVYRRLSPPVLCALMETACRQSADFHESLDPFAPALFPVSWAGDEVSPNWFDTARELTERWHHQQQIRDALNRPGIMTPELYHPVLDCFLRGLPRIYRGADAPAGAVVRIEIEGESGGVWQLRHGGDDWWVEPSSSDPAQARLILPEAIAWRIFTKGISREQALERVRWEGSPELALRALDLRAIVG